MVAADYRQRKKGLWLWRLVRRANGRYIVGKCVESGRRPVPRDLLLTGALFL